MAIRDKKKYIILSWLGEQDKTRGVLTRDPRKQEFRDNFFLLTEIELVKFQVMNIVGGSIKFCFELSILPTIFFFGLFTKAS